MVTKQINLTFLTNHIGIDNFNRLKESYNSIALDGHFQDNISDKELGVLFFETSVADNFFEKKQNLIELFYALPEITQKKIKTDLNIDDAKFLKWDVNTSKYFINELGFDKKFVKKKEVIQSTENSFTHFEKPELKFKTLKEYQSGVFFKIEDYISSTPFSRCILQMPTGSGKTRTAIELVCSLMNKTGKSVLWLANTEELCDQAYNSFLEIWHFLRLRESIAINHLRIANPSQVKDGVPIFHVTTLQSINSNTNEKLKKNGINLNQIELLIVDEAHISIAPTYRKTINIFLENGVKLVGLTATPGRHLSSNNGKDENKELSDFYFNKRFEIETNGVPPLEYLRKKGILSNAKFISVEGSNIDLTLTQSQLTEYNESGQIPKSIESILTNDSKRTAIIFDQLITLLKKGRKIIFFGTSIAHSKLISTLLTLKGFNSAHIDGNTGKYRSAIINDFKEGKLQIICNYAVLSTGFDDPKIDTVFMARKTNSIVLYSQIIGRGLRGPLIGGTDTCEIYTIFDNLLDLPSNNSIYSYFEDYFIN